MVLPYFAALLVYSLLSFGAVQPQTWFFVCMLWVVSFTALVLYRVLCGTSVTRECLAFTIAVAVLIFVGAKPALGVFAFGWAWIGAGRGTDRVLSFFNILIVVGLLEALLGFVQFFVSPGWIFGYIGPNRSSGTLINRNHFASLLGLIVPICLGYAYVGMRRFGDSARSYVYLLAGAFIATSLLFSLSRFGIFSFLATLLVLAVMIGLKDARARLATGLGLGMLGLVVAGALWIGVDVIVDRYVELLQDEALLREGRLLVFQDTINLISKYPLGVGFGNYPDVFRQHQTFRTDLLFDHAHNDYLETAAEFGLPAAAVLWGLVITAVSMMFRAFVLSRSPERSGILLGCIGSTTSMLIHSLTDFSLQIPSNAMLFLGLLGIGVSMCGAFKPTTLGESGFDA